MIQVVRTLDGPKKPYIPPIFHTILGPHYYVPTQYPGFCFVLSPGVGQYLAEKGVSILGQVT